MKHRETGQVPGPLLSFYSISVSRVFFVVGCPSLPYQQGGFFLGLLASGHQHLSIVRLLPPAWASAQGSEGGHSQSQEWDDDSREGCPRGQRESRRKQQRFFFFALRELITGQQSTAQVSAWDQPPYIPGQAIWPLLGSGDKLGMWGGH